MATSNFHYENRCILVKDEDFESGNVPSRGDYYKDSLRSYPASLLEEAEFSHFDVVLVSGYYADACIDYRRKDEGGYDIISGMVGFPWYFNTKKEVFQVVNTYIGKMSYKQFDKIVGKIGTMDIDSFIEQAFIKLQDHYAELEEAKVNEWLDELKRGYGYEELCVSCSFSNGETIYHRVG